jgi:predicted  nucleic acid-binding Zn-ribbon protein
MSINSQIRNEEQRLYDLEMRLDSVFSSSRKEYEKLFRKRKVVKKKLEKLRRKMSSQEDPETREFYTGDNQDD